ncbi:TetR/AcrR family transcriptional regulator [Sporomusa termitida]|uniref:HTH tetR-type domain-containing protein n=1 Tax=Sporomusa termitida TaxID=2377 RepID=A0A517DV31_9FIRM|nr:TetR/AcrR family transcriptional regulator [Sporomusa termitida]QDR81215.1 hypothetical protein SPTER_25890 [Sporomusa termitida]
MTNQEIKKQYIQTAFEITGQEGEKSVSIRRLAKEIGCNSAILYRCFQDMDELFLYVGFKFLKDYLHDVASLLDQSYDSIELYFKTWECFIEHSFQNPTIFNGLFFGKYPAKIDYISKDYYSMFPEEVVQFNDELKPIFVSGTLAGRNYMMLQRCVAEKIIDDKDTALLSNLIVQMYKGYLKDFLDRRKIFDNPQDREDMKNELLGSYRTIVNRFLAGNF